MEDWRRREILVVGLGLLFSSSCGGSRRVRPEPAPPADPEPVAPPAEPEPLPPEAPLADEEPLPPVSILDRVMPRSAWTTATVDPSRARPMKGVGRITIHHSGSNRIRTATGFATNAALIERIRAYHVEARGWADLGYHYLIDPGGRIWEGRPAIWQGAHVKDFNPHNLGVVLLGNFDLQQPSMQQLLVLPQFVQALRRRYRVSPDQIRSHQEWTPTTACPGKNLQPRFEQMRTAGQFV
jgi:hypothetical protein